MEGVKGLYGSIEFKTLCHIGGGITKGLEEPPYVREDIPIIPFFVLDKLIDEEIRKWGFKTLKDSKLNQVLWRPLIPMGVHTPTASAYPFLYYNPAKNLRHTAKVYVGEVAKKVGIGGKFLFRAFPNFKAPISEWAIYLGALKSLMDVGIGGDRFKGFGDCIIKLHSINNIPLKRKGVFEELWDDELFEPEPIVYYEGILGELAEYKPDLKMWLTYKKTPWHFIKIKFCTLRGDEFGQQFSLRYHLPKVECRSIIPVKIESDYIDIRMVDAMRFYTKCKWLSVYGWDKKVEIWGGRYNNDPKGDRYEAKSKWKLDRIVVEGERDFVEEFTDFVVSTLDDVEIKIDGVPGLYELEPFRVSVSEPIYKEINDYFKIDLIEDNYFERKN